MLFGMGAFMELSLSARLPSRQLHPDSERNGGMHEDWVANGANSHAFCGQNTVCAQVRRSYSNSGCGSMYYRTQYHSKKHLKSGTKVMGLGSPSEFGCKACLRKPEK